MKNKKDWSDLSGSVKLINRYGNVYKIGVYGSSEACTAVTYSSIEEFCRCKDWAFVKQMERHHCELLDCYGLSIPYSIIERVYCEVIPLWKPRYPKRYFYYNHEYDQRKDFRNGPIKWTSCYRGGSGYRIPRDKNLKINEELDFNRKEYKLNIKGRKYEEIDEWRDGFYQDNGRNWKRHRRTQWK